MSGVPAFQWESDLSTSVGLTTSEFRFAVSFFLSVFVSWCWRFVPTAQGTDQSTVGSFSPNSHSPTVAMQVAMCTLS